MATTRRPTLKDVAQAAGVSTTTASVVLTNRREGVRVPDATRHRVQQAAEDLGYRPNILARSLRTQTTRTIGFVSDEVTTTPFAVGMLAAAQDEAARHGYLLFVVNLGPNAPLALQEQAIDQLAQHQVGHFIYGCMYHRVVDPPAGLPADAVFLNCEASGGRHRSIVPDERQGAYEVVKELIEAGHRRIAFLDDHRHPPASRLRFNGFRAALAEHGLEYEPALHLETTPFVRGGLVLSDLIDLPDERRPSAVFCYNDRIAMGAYRAARARGLRVPEDLSIVGFDDQEFIASELDPPLTTVRLPHREMGRLAIQLVLDEPGALDDVPESEDGVIRIAGELVRRDSVAEPRGAWGQRTPSS
ncbi:LacI family DNA-binding transcriptional regulator [Lentzea aerocolonigenes]|uniref:LacI family DNA-binding transcriptional regulator n=1 Tax=Lentzea aerocolonigenes TaxID=68170 RepID=UPI0004C32887|nr:LacI family DNA-binding transcriptional regulator [Lentzea aerocolonigenes]